MMKLFAPILILNGFFMLGGCEDKQTRHASVQTHNQPQEIEYLATVTRPGSILHIVDLLQHKTIKQCNLNVGPGSGSLVMSPDKSVAYVLANHFSDVYGVNIDTCETIFSTQQSEANIRVKSIAAFAISPDGSKLYTHQNRVRLMHDRYEVLSSKVAEFSTDSGLKTKATRTFDAPRQVTIMDTLDTGEIILGGQDVFKMDQENGEYEVIIKSLNQEDSGYSPRDVLTVWPMSSINHEFIRLFSTLKWLGKAGDMENAVGLWGYESVDLSTGEVSSTEFGPIDVALFSGARRPGHLDKMYATLNHLKEYDIASKTELRSIDLEHTYYTLNFSLDGSRVYISGADADIAVYNADTFEKITNIPLTGDASMSNSVVFKRQGHL